jgi:hypothetical protein
MSQGSPDPASLTDEELVDAAHSGQLLMLAVPKARLTRELCLAFCERNGANLRFVPPAIRSGAFDLEAVRACGWAFGYLEAAAKTEALLLIAIGENFDVSMLGEAWAVPRGLLTQAVMDAARAHFKEDEVSKWVGPRTE